MRRDEERGSRAVSEVLGENPSVGDDNVSFQRVDWRNDAELRSVVTNCTYCIHMAGPFFEEKLTPLRAATDAGCRAYVEAVTCKEQRCR